MPEKPAPRKATKRPARAPWLVRTAHVACAGGCVRSEDGTPVCAQGCIGCGACVEACRFGAIALGTGGVARVDSAACKGCQACARACPQAIIRMIPATATIQVRCSNADAPALARKACANSCIGCGICVRKCPTEAIDLVDGHAVIDTEVCITCGMCAVSCPRGAIHDAFGIYAAA